MENSNKSFDSYIVESILTNNEFDIKEVLNLKSIKSLYFTSELYQKVVDLLKKKDIKAIELLEDVGESNGQFLDIMSFIDQSVKNYIVTVYDSIELEQDPQVIDIFPQ